MTEPTIPSTAFCLASVNNGLSLANPGGASWVTSNDTQAGYFERYGEAGFDLAGLEGHLKGKVTSNAAELNAWFAENGWPGMNLSYPPNSLGVGSIFDLLVDWQQPGESKDVYVQGSWYKGAAMRASGGLRGHNLSGYEHPMFELSTHQDGWKVFVVKADRSYDALDLPARSAELLAMPRQPLDFKELKFPVVGMEADVDVGWLAGMSVEGGFHIDQAIKKVRLRFDDKGAHAESAVAMVRGMESGIYTMDGPFFIIFWREGLQFSPFVAIAGNDTWTQDR